MMTANSAGSTSGRMATVERFRANLYAFLRLMRELIGLCYEAGNHQVKPDWITKTMSFLDAFPSDELIETFIEYSFIKDPQGEVTCIWDKIFQRDEKFISKNAGFLFRNMPMVQIDKIAAFQVLFESKDKAGNPVINLADRNSIWDYLNGTVRIVLVYIHEQRNPKVKLLSDGTTKNVYTREYRRDIDLKRYLQNYPNLELQWV